MATFLLEMLTEEIPANALAGAAPAARRAVAGGLAEAGLANDAVRSLSTSRAADRARRRPSRAPAGPRPSGSADRRRASPSPRTARRPRRPRGSPARSALGRRPARDRLDAEGRLPGGDRVHSRAGRPTEILAELVPGGGGRPPLPEDDALGTGRPPLRPAGPRGGGAARLTRWSRWSCSASRSGAITVGHRVHAPEPFELDPPQRATRRRCAGAR